MNIVINNKDLVKDIQGKFNIIYPFLKVEFFKKLKPGNNNFGKGEKFNSSESIGRFAKFFNEIQIDISSKKTVGQFENDLREAFELLPQVFRRSGNMWIETSLTNDWTLERQNKAGELFNSILREKATDETSKGNRFDNV